MENIHLYQMERAMEKETFIREFVKFLKERHILGEYIAEVLVTKRINSTTINDYLEGKGLQYDNIIDDSLLWRGTKRGQDFYKNLHSNWQKYWLDYCHTNKTCIHLNGKPQKKEMPFCDEGSEPLLEL